MTDNDLADDNGDARKRRWKKRVRMLGIVLGPAVLGGLFTIAPTIYQVFTAPKAVLSFSKTVGPAIHTSSGARQISTFVIENGGKISLTNVMVDVTSGESTIESSAIDAPKGVVAKEQASPKEYRVVIERLLPGDIIKASVMAVSDRSLSELSFAARSNEVRGTEFSARSKVDSETDLVSRSALALAGTLTAALGVIVILWYARRYRSSFVEYHPLAKEMLISYIAALSGIVPPEMDELRDGKMTYIRAADAFLSLALRGDEKVKSQCIIAMKALLHCDREMIEDTAQGIRDNLRMLGVAIGDAEFKKIRKGLPSLDTDTLMARRIVASFFA